MSNVPLNRTAALRQAVPQSPRATHSAPRTHMPVAVSYRDGAVLTVLFERSICELYQSGYRLVAAKPGNLWGVAVCGGARSLQRRLGEARISINL